MFLWIVGFWANKVNCATTSSQFWKYVLCFQQETLGKTLNFFFQSLIQRTEPFGEAIFSQSYHLSALKIVLHHLKLEFLESPEKRAQMLSKDYENENKNWLEWI